jgi:ribosome-associated translation inhibitor RaiA
MNFVFRSLVVKASSSLARQLQEQIGHLRKLIPIESAEAVLEQLPHPQGVFRLQVHLAVPGPDVRAESTGYTVQETLLKMHKELRRRLQLRSRRRSDRGLNGRRPGSNPK